MINDAIRSHNAETEATAVAARELNDALEDQGELAEFDKLLAVDRFDLMIRVAELLPLMAADGHPPQRVSSPGRFFDPMRISAMIDALPLTMTNDGFDLNTNAPKTQERLEALGSRYGYDVTGANAAAGIDAELTQLAVMGHKFLGIFLGPTMQLIDNSNAETALSKALRAFLPPSVIGQAATVDAIAVRLTQQQVQSQFNLGSLRALGAKVGFFLNVLAIGSELQKLSRRSSFDSQAFRNAATAVLKSADGVIAAAEQMGYSLGKRGIRTTAVFVTLPMLLLDGIAAADGIG